MIKKFNEYIKENKKSISDLNYEIDDHTLRLKEVFNCDIHISSNIGKIYDPLTPNLKSSADFIWIIIKPNEFDGSHSFIWKNKEEIKNEIYQIKRRLEYMFNITMIIRDPMHVMNVINYSRSEIEKFNDIFDTDHFYNFYQIVIIEK